jgi:hypothetical protein
MDSTRKGQAMLTRQVIAEVTKFDDSEAMRIIAAKLAASQGVFTNDEMTMIARSVAFATNDDNGRYYIGSAYLPRREG